MWFELSLYILFLVMLLILITILVFFFNYRLVEYFNVDIDSK